MISSFRIVDLRCKEVINIKDGFRLGYVCDVEIEICSGKVIALIVPGKLKCFGLLGREDDYVVPWEAVEQIGEDIILIMYDIQKVSRRSRDRLKLFK